MAGACCNDAGKPGATHRARAQAGGQGTITAYLVGNPNAGKTTLFNQLTGARQRTGNWAGVTVERREGSLRDAAGEIRFIDLPGVYSISATPEAAEAGLDEAIARNAVMDGRHDVLLNIVDASNLERNLYLTAQLAEAGQPMVVALNMVDVAEAQGRPVNAAALQKALGVPVVPIIARSGQGLDALLRALREVVAAQTVPAVEAPWPLVVREAIERLEPLLEKTARERGVSPRWLAVRLLEGDPAVQQAASAAALSQAAKARARIMKQCKEVPDLVLADARYDLAHALTQAAMQGDATAQAAAAAAAAAQTHAPAAGGLANRFDRIALHRIGGPLVFLAAMYLLFTFSINIGGAFVDFFDILSGAIFVDGLRVVLEGIGLPEWLIALLADGVGAGIQTVATFIPIIGALFIGLTFLEDSGYMARAAFVADRLMRAIGLPGKAFVPLIVGFGCNVPAVMAARTLENPRDRIATILMTPFMSCGARLTVFALFAAAFFGGHGQNVVFLLYLAGILAAVLTGLLLKRTLLTGAGLPFMMELPNYHLPAPRSLLLHAWLRLKGFIFGAGKIIVVVVAVLGLLNSLGTDGSFGNQDSEKSVLSVIGKEITPAFAPLGIQEDNWPATVGLFTGVFAKEVVVGTLNALYSEMARQQAASSGAAQAAEEEAFDLMARVREAFASIPANLAGLKDLITDPLGLAAVGDVDEVVRDQGVEASAIGTMVRHFDGRIGAFAYMLFVLLYFPCSATFGAIAREIGLRWAAFSALWSLWIAWFAAVGFYQAATFVRHPVQSGLWLLALALGMLAVIAFIRWLGKHQVLSAGGRLIGGAAAE